MAFYLSPARGNIKYSTLEVISIKRLTFLLQVAECNGSVSDLTDLVQDTQTVETHSDFLIDGSDKDVVSHFMLRLALCENEECHKFLVTMETRWFSFKVSSMEEHELLAVFKHIHRHLKYVYGTTYDPTLNTLQAILQTLQYIGQQVTWEKLAKCCSQSCESHSIVLPFQHALSLVSKRSVAVYKGHAKIPCSKFHEVLSGLFEKMLSNGLMIARERIARTREDDRITRLISKLKALYKMRSLRHNKHMTYYSITHEDIDGIVHMFPVCMQNIHFHLRRRHRLKHHDRIQYTLFLKEAGLPVNEAIQFWKIEYSKTSDHNTCKHEWSKEEKRYTYNIRHLYGLEGSMINYRGHSCPSLQDRNIGPQEVGGCPFKHYDKTHLNGILNTVGLNTVQSETLNHLCGEWQYGKACARCIHFTVDNTRPSDDRFPGKSESQEFKLMKSELYKPKNIDHLQKTIQEGNSTKPVVIYKPVDYLHSYRQLVTGMTDS